MRTIICEAVFSVHMHTQAVYYKMNNVDFIMLLIVLCFMSTDHEGTGDEGGSLSRTVQALWKGHLITRSCEQA